MDNSKTVDLIKLFDNTIFLIFSFIIIIFFIGVIELITAILEKILDFVQKSFLAIGSSALLMY